MVMNYAITQNITNIKMGNFFFNHSNGIEIKTTVNMTSGKDKLSNKIIAETENSQNKRQRDRERQRFFFFK